jgi:hypothetical protein
MSKGMVAKSNWKKIERIQLWDMGEGGQQNETKKERSG